MSKIGFVFSGQGSQYPGMCRKIYDKEETVRKCFKEISEITGYDMAEICFGEKTDLLNETSYAQLAVFTASAAQLMLFNEKCICEPDFVAGNSIGEYAALYSAGCISLKDAALLVKYRALYMDSDAKANQGVMYDVRGIETEETEKIVEEGRKDGIVCISNYNGRNNVVISGEKTAVNNVMNTIVSRGGRVIKLNVSSGFHSTLMKRAAEKFEEKVAACDFKDFNVQIISNITGRPYESTEQIKGTLSKQITSPVKWFQSMRYMEDNDCDTVFEFGPKRVLKNLIQNNTGIGAFSFDSEDSGSMLRKYDRHKMELIAFGEFLREAVVHQNNNDDLSGYSEFVTGPYRKIENVYLQMKNADYKPTGDDIVMARDMLLSILLYKKTEEAEQICSRVFEKVYNRFVG